MKRQGATVNIAVTVWGQRVSPVFDAALDVTTDARLRAALAPETEQAAVLVVAQRVSTITGADEILVLEDGEIVGRGTHDELLASSETYQEIVESQLSVEEAAA